MGDSSQGASLRSTLDAQVPENTRILVSLFHAVAVCSGVRASDGPMASVESHTHAGLCIRRLDSSTASERTLMEDNCRRENGKTAAVSESCSCDLSLLSLN